MPLTYKPTVQNTMRAISNLAVGLYGSSPPDADKIFELTPTAIGINLVRMIRSRSPRLGKLITNVAPLVVLCITFMKLFRQGQTLVWILAYIRTKLTATITVPSGHPLLQPVMKWMTSQGMKTTARAMTLKQREKDGYYGRNDTDDDEEDSKKRDLLECQPNEGKYLFRFNGNVLEFHVHSKKIEQTSSSAPVLHVGPPPVKNLQVSISCFSVWAGTRPVQEFLKHIEAIHATSKHARTTIYRPNWDKEEGFNWAPVSRPSRPLDSVTLPDEKKVPLVADMESYLSKETEIFYASRGISLRRGYLLYGPPGTGKSSFSAAIAGHFDLELFVVNLTTPNLDDKGLEELFDDLPDRCVVLMEDIDSAGIQRENMRQAPKATDNAQGGEKARVTLSGLPCSQEERLVILTSNAPDSLDPAMVRPGRIDMRVYLGNATTETLMKMFKHIFTETTQEGNEKSLAVRNQYLSRLADTFASSVPSDMLSPAEVQGYLMIHRNDPEGAVKKAQEWAAEQLEIRARGSNVAMPKDVTESGASVEADVEKADTSSDDTSSIAKTDSEGDTPPPSPASA